MKKKDIRDDIAFRVDLKKCCNLDSYGEICVKCGRCNTRIEDLTVWEFEEARQARQIFQRCNDN